jgi:lipoprotein Spr
MNTFCKTFEIDIMRRFKHIIFIGCILTGFLSACKSRKHLNATQPPSNTEQNSSVSNSQQLKKKYAPLLVVDENKIENVALYSLIDSWYATPYKYGGCNKDGVDCSNFASVIYREIYQKQLTGSSASIFNQCKVVQKEELQEGDLLFFKVESNTISHIGVYLQNNKFVHATTKKGVMINDLDEVYYKKYFFKAGRVN